MKGIYFNKLTDLMTVVMEDNQRGKRKFRKKENTNTQLTVLVP